MHTLRVREGMSKRLKPQQTRLEESETGSSFDFRALVAGESVSEQKANRC